VSFSGWVWKIAANVYGRWAKKRWYSAESDAADIDAITELLADEENLENALVLQEDMMLMRRELAFIRSDYRSILVAHYLEDKSVSMIAREFGIPPGTVKTKLISSRKKLREGMTMAREFGKRSYNPENVYYSMNGKEGDNGQPWSIVTHLMYQNIFLEVYENPETAEELALELGIALPYMEDELEFLVREQLLRKEGNKYVTNFRIISREEQLSRHNRIMAVQQELAKLFENLIDTWNAACEKKGIRYYESCQSWEDVKWTLLCNAIDQYIWDYSDYDGTKVPDRPNNGRWELTGYETADFIRPKGIGMHGGFNENVNNGQYKFYGWWDHTPQFLTYEESNAMLAVAVGEEPNPEYADKLVEYGYAVKTETGYALTVVIFETGLTDRVFGRLEEADQKNLRSIGESIRSIMDNVGYIGREYIFDRAMVDGWIRFDSETTSKVVGAYIYR
ncbi:MAG: sigma-70 family RNA polymerase sigma factor, partial [Clostridia bacterium]|nr:sigma-70 family RNA polymerase sigma factor [Clostridia bacterium]